MRVERDDLSGIERVVWASRYVEALARMGTHEDAWAEADRCIERLRDEAQRREVDHAR